MRERLTTSRMAFSKTSTMRKLTRRRAQRKAGFLLLLGYLLLAMPAHPATKPNTIRITVLDSETRSSPLGENNGVPRNCDALNYDAYCHSSKTAQVINTMLVQVGDEATYRISCTIETKWSKCVPLEKGESFDARKEKRGITVYYVDDRGKLCKQLYTYVGGGGSPPLSSSHTGTLASNPAEKASAVPLSPVTSENTGGTTVKCTFTSDPAGAEIILDGSFVGSAPSVLSLDPGNHKILMSLPGFLPWNRDLVVFHESELIVNAVLQRAE